MLSVPGGVARAVIAFDMGATIARVRSIVGRVSTPCFHLSLVTEDLPRQRAFYAEVLGCTPGRVGPDFQDFDFFGHQLTFHQREAVNVPVYETFHFGAIVALDVFERVHVQLRARGATFVIEPVVQQPGSVNERRKLVFLDPSGYAVELKAYADASRVFADEAAYARATRTT
jgi:extradiol dioxygenase family protein